MLPRAAGALHLEPGDHLRVRAGARESRELLGVEGVEPASTDRGTRDADIRSETDTLIETVVAPDSQLGGQRIADIDFPGRHGAQVLALRHAGELQQHDLTEARLRGGTRC